MNDQTTHKCAGKEKLHTIWWMLKVTYGGAALVLGLDKFLDLIAFWPLFVSPIVTAIVPFSIPPLLKIVGSTEIFVGLLILTWWPRFGAYLLAAWILFVAINLASMGQYYDLIARDLVIAVGAIAFAMLTDVIKSDCYECRASS